MDVRVTPNLDNLAPDTVMVVAYFEGSTVDDLGPEAAQAGGERLRALVEGKHVRSKLYEPTFLPPESSSPGLLLVGAGKREEASLLGAMRVTTAASRYLTARGYPHLAIPDRAILPPADFARAAVEGAIRGAYNAAIKKTKQDDGPRLESVTLISQRTSSELDEGMRRGQTVGECSSIARDLVNLPPNDLTPSSFAQRAQELAQQHGLDFEALDENRMRELGMGSLLGVAAGSQQPPRLIVMRYGAQDAQVKLALVGKGLTFDSGGLSLKTAEGMETMKGDMGGGAAVVAGMVAVARLQPKNISVTGYVGATENMPGGSAMRPGDVLTAMTGETIEVLNTDAEGRLVLADVLAYAVRQGATHIVDFATLTGAAMISLGSAASLAVGKPMDWVARVVEAADRGFDRSWQMPLYAEYREVMNSDVADIKNIGSRGGGALNAAAFLSDFVGDVPWAHMDIAGTSFVDRSTAYQPHGGTGVGVGLIASLVQEMSSQ